MAIPQPFPLVEVGEVVEVMGLEAGTVIVRARGQIWRTTVTPAEPPLRSADRLTVLGADIPSADVERNPAQGGGRYRVTWRQHLVESAWGRPGRT